MRFMAGLCAVLFVMSTTLALALFSVDRNAFKSSTYKQAFETQNIYERMPGIIANIAMDRIKQNPDAPLFMENLSANDWNIIITGLLPPAEIKSISDEALDSIFSYINGKSDSANVSLLPLKRHLAGDAGVQAALQVLRAQPDCTAEQIANVTVTALTGGQMELCNPPQETIGLITPLIESQIAFGTLAIPDQVNLIPASSSGNVGNDPRNGLNNLRLLIRFSLILPLGFLLLITLLAVRSLRDWLTWWGYPFLASGILSALTGWIGTIVVANQFQRILQTRASAYLPASFIDIGHDIAGSVARQIMTPVDTSGVVMTILGLIMIIALFMISRQERTNRYKQISTNRIY